MEKQKEDVVTIKSSNKKNTNKSVKSNKKIETKNIANKDNKVVVITGVTSGMGNEVTKRLMEKGGYTIIGTCRILLSKSINEMASWNEKYTKSDLHLAIGDLTEMAQVRNLFYNIKIKLQKLGFDRIDILYLNAGQMLQKIDMSSENNELQWASNYLANVLLIELLLPLLRNSKDARIILTTCDKALKTKLNWDIINNPKKYSATALYNQSKLAELMFALEFDYRHLDEKNIRTFVVNPGRVRTNLGLRYTTGFQRFLCNLRNLRACSVEEGIASVMYLIEAPNLPSRVVYYKNMCPKMPSNYALDLCNREELYKSSFRILNLPLESPQDLEE